MNVVQAVKEWVYPEKPGLLDDNGLLAKVHLVATCAFWGASCFLYPWPTLVGAAAGFGATLATRNYIKLSPPTLEFLKKAEEEWKKPGVRGASYVAGLVVLYVLGQPLVFVASAAAVIHLCG